MHSNPTERAIAKSRLSEIHAELRAIESKIDMEAWKKLFGEQLRLEAQLKGAGTG